MRYSTLLVLFCLLLGCRSSTSDEPSVTPTADAAQHDLAPMANDAAPTAEDGLAATENPHPFSYSPCPVSDRIGGFAVTLAHDYTGVNGEVADGVVPGNVPEVVAEEGYCRLLRKPSFFCSPACVPGETCGADGKCIPYPENQSVGLVELAGLKTALSMEAKWGNYYGNSGSMEHPGFDPGALLTLHALGADLPGFTLGGVGVVPLTMAKSQLTVDDTAGLELEWTSGPSHDGVQMHIELNINNHGSTSAWIACDCPDTGTLEIPHSLLAALFQIGVSGFPSLHLSRRSVHSAHLNVGCVDFKVHADHDASIQVAGVTSCTSDAQCGPGQTCGSDLQCHGS